MNCGIRSHAREARFALVSCALLAFTSACRAGSDTGDPAEIQKRLKPIYNPTTGRLDELTYDTNEDGKPDIRAFMNGPNLVRAEVDENGDGRPDRWEYYVAPARSALDRRSGSLPPSAARPLLDHVDEASNDDGRINRREFYQGGQLTRVEEDTNGDGRIDRWETYDRGVVATMDLDLDHDGKPDRRLIYSRDGNTVRSESLQDGQRDSAGPTQAQRFE